MARLLVGDRAVNGSDLFEGSIMNLNYFNNGASFVISLSVSKCILIFFLKYDLKFIV